MLSKSSFAIKRTDAEKSNERSKVFQPVLNWCSSDAPAALSMKRVDSSELFCGVVAYSMGCGNWIQPAKSQKSTALKSYLRPGQLETTLFAEVGSFSS